MGSQLNTSWVVAHLLHGWRTFGGFLLEATRQGVRLDEADLAALETAKKSFDAILSEQRSLNEKVT